MSIIPSLLTETAFFRIPQGLLEWVAWIIFSVFILLLLRKWHRFNKPMTENRWGLLLILSISVPLTSLMIGLRLPASVVTSSANYPVGPAGPALMIFSTIPWMIAAGLLGPISAAGIAFYSGIFLAFWETHDPFTPLILAFLATIFSAAINQRYRQQIFRLIRHPLVSAVLISLVYPALYLIITPITAHQYSDARIEYTLTHLGIAALVTSLQLLIGGITAELVAMALPDEWGERGPLQVSPIERTIEARLVYFLAPLVVVTIIAMVAGAWYFSGRSARGMIETSMRNSAQVAAKNVPSFLEIGQILVTDMSAKFTKVDFSEINKLNQTLAGGRSQESFFDQFFIFNRYGEIITAYPDQTLTQSGITVNENYAVEGALRGYPISIIPATAEETGGSGMTISFVAPIFNEQQQADGAIIGRTSLSSNQILLPTQVSFAGLADIEGLGYITDSDGTILLHSDPAGEQAVFVGQVPDELELFENRTPDGRPALIYKKPIEGSSWFVYVVVPEIQSKLLAVTIAIPILAITLVLAILVYVLIHMGLTSVSGSLKRMAVEAERMSLGDLNQPIPVTSEDEVGILGQSFEKMRRSLKKRIDDMDRLFAVSQEIASNLVIEEAIQPVLDASMIAGVNSVRVVLPTDVIPELFGDELTPVVYSAGSSGHVYDYLDDQILAYLRRHDRLILPNLSRPRIFDLPADETHPDSLLAFSLRKEDTYYGAYWITHDQIHDYEQGEINYFHALANQATTAATNTRLYLSAEVERQRLSAIIASSPDPVLVTDKQNRLVLVNPAAAQVLDIPLSHKDVPPIDRVISQGELVDLLESSVREKQTLDIKMPDGKIYLAIATSVIADGQPVGRVCTLRDVTRVKEVNALKSEFVSTVSHDLRSPLALIHGYATMVEMVGKLNEEQANYLEKIIENVESMSHLVNNLLDLRRIEAGIGLQLEMVAVREIMQQVVDSLSVHAAQKRIQVRLNVPFDTVPLIEADHALLQKAVYNLVDNAIKFSHQDGQVDIKVYMKQDRMYFEISDTGSGISPVDQEQLFEKFFYRTTQDGVHEARGSGLGLAIVKSIADRHHGEVWVESQLGKGSTFYLVIPLRQSDVTEQETLDKA